MGIGNLLRSFYHTTLPRQGLGNFEIGYKKEQKNMGAVQTFGWFSRQAALIGR
jgi:hypothetical protein